MKRDSGIVDRGVPRITTSNERLDLGTFLLCGAIVAGLLQNVLLVEVPQIPSIQYLDDSLVLMSVIVFCFSTFRSNPAPWMWLTLLIVYGTVQMFNGMASNVVNFSEAFFLFRQVLVPFLLMLCGFVMSVWSVQVVCKLTVVASLLTAAYCLVEFVMGPPVDPVPLAVADGLYIYESGLPGYYLGFDLGGASVIRLGGPLLNPPTCGVLLATGALITLFGVRKRASLRWILFSVQALALLGTYSRAGLLLLVVGVIVPLTAKYINPVIMLLLVAVIAWPVASEVATHGGSASHVNGLLAGLKDALANPLGRGFGFAGNFGTMKAESSESLWGIGLSALGVGFAVALLVLSFKLLRRISHDSTNWMAVVGLGAIIIACFAETASSLTGTIPLWVLAGAGFINRQRSLQEVCVRRDESRGA